MSIDEIIDELRGFEEHLDAVYGIGVPPSFGSAIEKLKTHPEAQPNEPLTPEELREMDGQPVWIERPGYGAKWALVNVWAKATNIIYLTCNNGMPLHPLPELESGAKIYRRPPKEEQK